MIYIIMGVSGCGKTTVGKLLAKKLALPFHDADDFHSQGNIEKMKQGTPLTDDDRKPWLFDLALHIAQWNRHEGAVLACSALKEEYREMLTWNRKEEVLFIFLKGDKKIILDRMKARPDHFYPPELLESQVRDLEEPLDALTVSIENEPRQICDEIVSVLVRRNILHRGSGGSAQQTADIGIFGLGLMGENLALNMAGRGLTVSVFNRSSTGEEDRVKHIVAQHQGKRIIGTMTIDEFTASICKPRKIMIMVKAGKPVDEVIDQLLPYLDPGDLIIDGGNSHYQDTARRVAAAEARGLLFVGCGVSGGGQGALCGPSLMPGGSAMAWDMIRAPFQAIAAKLDDETPCCQWIGPGGSGHFVKMVHNGIEYALMQVMAESVAVMRTMCGMNADEIAAVLSRWNDGELRGYLMGIGADILLKKDHDGSLLVDRILDSADQKGTGRDAAIAALELGVAAPLLDEAVHARFVSALTDERMRASQKFPGPDPVSGPALQLVDDLEASVYCSMVVAHAQGFSLLWRASAEYGWNLNYTALTRLWQRGCIIQSDMMHDIEGALRNKTGAQHIIMDPFFIHAITQRQEGWRRFVSTAVLHGQPVPAFSSALAYFDAYRSKKLPANFIQAMRDYFGSHGYERIDAPRGRFFHTDWKE